MARNLEVVVVHDEEQITELLKTFIQCVTQEITVHTFNDSVIAKDFIVKNTVDVLITDYKMPRYDGLQLMEAAAPGARKIMNSVLKTEHRAKWAPKK